MRIVDIRERTVPISRYADPAIPSGGLTTSVVAVVTDVVRDGKPVIGFGFSSIGRFGQGGLIRERFAPRLLRAAEPALLDEAGTNLDPFRAWTVMMAGEKPGGHGERCVAVGTLDMAIWDAAAKIAELPLNRHLASVVGIAEPLSTVPAYAGGGYYYPADDVAQLDREAGELLDQGYTRLKIKIGAVPLAEDIRRIETVLKRLPAAGHLAVDAMNNYDAEAGVAAAAALAPFGLWWLEDMCDPLDFPTYARVAEIYPHPIAVGESLFSAAEAALMNRCAGLRPDHDILEFDPVHCYGVPGYLQIIRLLETAGWPRTAFWPHGGHLFSLHLVSGLRLGGTEINPLCFKPFGGLTEGATVSAGSVDPPDLPGIGLERRLGMRSMFVSLLGS